MAVAWNNDSQFDPDYYVGIHKLDDEVPDEGKEGPWWSLPFTPIDAKAIPELSATVKKHTGLWVAMANLEKAFNPSVPHPRWPNDSNTDETDPEGGTRITDHIEHLSFQRFTYDDTVDPETERLQPALLNHITLPTPTVDWGWSGYLLYPYKSFHMDPENKTRCQTTGEVRDDYGIAGWPDWADWGFMGDCPPSPYGKVKGGGWLTGMLWYTDKTSGSITAIPQWSHSPLLCGINPEQGNIAWKKEGWTEYHDDGESAYELYSTILLLDDQLLVHFERYEWEMMEHKCIRPLQMQAFNDWFYCRPEDTHVDTVTGDGETTLFELSADAGGLSYERGKGLINSFRWGPRVKINGDWIVDSGPAFFIDFASFNPKIVIAFSKAPPAGCEIEIHYSVKKDCAFEDPDFEGVTPISPPTGGYTTGNGAGGVSSAWQECCASDKANCWWKDLYVCQYYPSPSSCYGPHPCGDGSAWTNCPFDGLENDEWEGRFCEVVNIHIGPCQHKMGIAPPDVSRITNVLDQIRPKLNEIGLEESVTLQTPVRWKQGYRWYNAKTGSKLSEILVENRECDYKPKRYKNIRIIEETYELDAEVTQYDENLQVIGEPGQRVEFTLTELGEDEKFFWSNTASYNVRTNKNDYEGCACFPEGCCSTWGGEEWDFASVVLGSNLTVQATNTYLDPIVTSRSFVNKTNCGPPDMGGNFDAQVGYLAEHKTYKRWGIVTELEDMPVEQCKKTPWLTYNAVVDADGKSVYFLPGRDIPANAEQNSTPGVDEPSGKEPIIDDIDPSNNNTGEDPPPQNIQVEIDGRNFIDVIAVFFGDTVATEFTVDSATQITCTTPGGIPEEELPKTVDVTVVTQFGTSNAVSFTYLPGGIIEV